METGSSTLSKKWISRRAKQLAQTEDKAWSFHKSALEKNFVRPRIFEFGAGKNLAQNLYLSSFAEKQVVIDLNRMIDFDLCESARKFLIQELNLELTQKIDSVTALAQYNIDYLAPLDASKTDFPDAAFDACVSTNTLEHIPEKNITEILLEVHRLLVPNGILTAKIDYSDHYSHTDRNISKLNFLHFDELKWRKYNHNSHYQNRLRHYDFLNIITNCGFEILEEHVENEEPNPPRELIAKYMDAPKSWKSTGGYIVAKKRPTTVN